MRVLWRLAGVLAGAIVASGLSTGPDAQAASPMDGWDPTMIISDASFYQATSMTQAETQSFLDLKGANCVANPTTGVPCLKRYTADTPAMAASEYCAALPALTGATAAQIISATTTACGVNPQVMLATIQKEQALVTASGADLTARKYAHATGAGCPDFQPCDPAKASFFLQVYTTSRAFSRYRLHPEALYYPPGRSLQVLYHPESSCGRATFTIQNVATSSLYQYTPYVPNAAALANPGGTGDYCSTYGNRNFYRLMRSWFPASMTVSTAPPIATSPPSVMQPGLLGVLREAERVGGWTTLGGELSEVKCTSFVVGPCTKGYVGGTIEWSEASGAVTRLKLASAPTWVRWSGPDRYATAATLSANTSAPGRPVVYVASGESFPDALAGSAAAYRDRAPLLLVARDALPAATASELNRLKPGRIVILGGLGAVSDAVAAQLRTLTTGTVTRLSGPDRYATAVDVSKVTFTSAAAVLIASGTGFPDALGAANLLPRDRGPILLAGPSGLDAGTLAEIRRLGATRATLIGGESVVPASVAGQLAAAGISVTRLAGPDRYATNLSVAKAAYGTPTPGGSVFLASGESFPDGLSGGAPSASASAPLFLTRGGCIPLATATYLRQLAPSRIVILGGLGALSEEVARLRLC